VPYTNNACERALRPSVIFRKVTGGFRAEWGAKVYAAAASVIATGRLYRLTALAALRAALEGEPRGGWPNSDRSISGISA
jgi:transposase